MYEVAHYTRVNNLGTAVLLEALIEHPVQRLVVASSMSLYGEGLYRGDDGTTHGSAERSLEQLRRGDWELRGADGGALHPMATPETKPPALASVYALSKYDQERMCLMIGRAYKHPDRRACASSTPTVRARRCPTPTPACWRSSPSRLLNDAGR